MGKEDKFKRMSELRKEIISIRVERGILLAEQRMLKRELRELKEENSS